MKSKIWFITGASRGFGRVWAQEAHEHFGRLDVVLNNAGYSLVGMVEEANEAEVRALFDTNYFGLQASPRWPHATTERLL
jgi:NAD(P)-dependent dehydrogenase (short-subunit alcohol dehydrogenase family)